MSQTSDLTVATAAGPAAAATHTDGLANIDSTYVVNVNDVDDIVAGVADVHVDDSSTQSFASEASDTDSLSLLSYSTGEEDATDSDDSDAGAPAAAAVTPAPPVNSSIRLVGPWVAGKVYGIVPLAPLTLVPDNGEKWYAITMGRYVGCTNSVAIADGAVTCVSHSLRTGYGSQALAVATFNAALASGLGLIQVRQVV